MTRELTETLRQGHTRRVQAVAHHPRTRLLATAGDDSSVVVWSRESEGYLMKCQLPGHFKCVRELEALSETPSLVISGSDDATARCWDMAREICVAVLQGHAGPVLGLCSDSKVQIQFTGSADKTVIGWDPRTSGVVAALGPFPSQVSALCCHQGKSRLVVPCFGGGIRVLDVRYLRRSGAMVVTDQWNTGHRGTVFGCCCVEDEDQDIVCTSGWDDGHVKAWTIDGGCLWDMKCSALAPCRLHCFFRGDPSNQLVLLGNGLPAVDGGEVPPLSSSISHESSEFVDAVLSKMTLPCQYAQDCWRFVTNGLDFRDMIVVLNHEMDRCFCYDCRERRGTTDLKLVVRGNPPKPYGLPHNWVKFSLSVSQNYVGRGALTNWHVGFHGTHPDTAVKIVRSGGELNIVGDRVSGGHQVGLVDGHLQGQPFVFLSPSIRYCSTHHYCKPKEFEGTQFQVAFQVRIKPGEYIVQTQTIVANDVVLDPLFHNAELEWKTNVRNVVALTGLMVRKDRIEDHGEFD